MGTISHYRTGSKEFKPGSPNFTLLETKCLSQNLHHFGYPQNIWKMKKQVSIQRLYPISSTMILPNVTTHTGKGELL